MSIHDFNGETYYSLPAEEAPLSYEVNRGMFLNYGLELRHVVKPNRESIMLALGLVRQLTPGIMNALLKAAAEYGQALTILQSNWQANSSKSFSLCKICMSFNIPH